MTDTTTLILVCLGAALALVVVVLTYLLLRGEPKVRHRRTKIGVFLERDQLPTYQEEWDNWDKRTQDYPTLDLDQKTEPQPEG